MSYVATKYKRLSTEITDNKYGVPDDQSPMTAEDLHSYAVLPAVHAALAAKYAYALPIHSTSTAHVATAVFFTPVT